MVDPEVDQVSCRAEHRPSLQACFCRGLRVLYRRATRTPSHCSRGLSAVVHLRGDGIARADREDTETSGISSEPPPTPNFLPSQRKWAKRHVLINERIQLMSQRTRICSRRVWEETYLVDLKGKTGAEEMKPSMAQCCICVSEIAMSDQVRGMACGHSFHLLCLAEWFIQDHTFMLSCPLCRIPLSKQGHFADAAHAHGSVNT
mmetsp:Transcript_21417/g.54110  ORF Transcript_21417/g.54110 Transcript_21417/m.54110 type:complete len:203 (-) Transcript_21417:236-844(-)